MPAAALYSAPDRVKVRSAMRLTIVRLELLASAVLLGAAAAWSRLRGLGLAAALGPAAEPAALGVAAGLALAATLPLVTAPWARRALLLRGLRRTWDALESGLGPSLGRVEVLVLAVCSAVSEEAFFRGVLQPEIGLVPASALFGLLHPLGLAYVVWAMAVGAGLGALFAATGSLVAPIAAHGTYNLVALAYLRRRSSRQEEVR